MLRLRRVAGRGASAISLHAVRMGAAAGLKAAVRAARPEDVVGHVVWAAHLYDFDIIT